MSMRSHRRSRHALTRLALVPAASAGGRLRRSAIWLPSALLAFIAAAAALQVVQPASDDPRLAAALQGQQRLQQELQHARASLGMAQAHGAELEREMQTLQQQLREAREELLFFRRAGASRP